MVAAHARGIVLDCKVYHFKRRRTFGYEITGEDKMIGGRCEGDFIEESVYCNVRVGEAAL